MIIDGYWWMLIIIDDYWWLLVIVDDYWWLLMIVDYYWWLLMCVDDYWWLLVIIGDCWWLLMIVDDYWCLLMIVGDYSWLLMIIDAYWCCWWLLVFLMFVDDYFFVSDKKTCINQSSHLKQKPRELIFFLLSGPHILRINHVCYWRISPWWICKWVKVCGIAFPS